MPRMRELDQELQPVLRRERLDRKTFFGILDKLEVPAREQNIRWLKGEDPWLLQKMESLIGQIESSQESAPLNLKEMLDSSLVLETP
jgi:hypothetical protein